MATDNWLDEVRARVDAFEKPPSSPEKVEAASRLMVAALDDTPRLLRCAEAHVELLEAAEELLRLRDAGEVLRGHHAIAAWERLRKATRRGSVCEVA